MEKSGMNDKISSLLTEFEKMKQEDDIDNFKEKDPTKSLIETANWKTYKNEKVRFEIKYPSNYRLELFEDITPYKETEEQIKVNSLNQNLPEEISNYDVLSIGAYGYNFFPEMKSSWSELKESIIGDKVGGYLVTEISGMKMLRLSPHYSPMGNIYNSYARFYNENGDVVDLWVELENENKEQKKNIIFNQILSTFKFTN